MGGGNTAVEEALSCQILYLVQVVLIHRRDKLRARKNTSREIILKEKCGSLFEILKFQKFLGDNEKRDFNILEIFDSKEK